MTHQKLYLYTKYISTTYFSKLLFVNVVSCQVSTWLKLNVSHNPKLESRAQRKKRSTNSTAWSWPNCQKRIKAMSQTNPNLSNLICSFVPTNFWQFWVTFISQKFIDHFFRLSFPSQHGCTHYKRVGSLCPEPDYIAEKNA